MFIWRSENEQDLWILCCQQADLNYTSWRNVFHYTTIKMNTHWSLKSA